MDYVEVPRFLVLREFSDAGHILDEIFQLLAILALHVQPTKENYINGTECYLMFPNS